jgi:hypothetical protein
VGRQSTAHLVGSSPPIVPSASSTATLAVAMSLPPQRKWSLQVEAQSHIYGISE